MTARTRMALVGLTVAVIAIAIVITVSSSSTSKRDVAPGHPITFDFAATKDGIFEVELEGRKRQIASLRVQP